MNGIMSWIAWASDLGLIGLRLVIFAGLSAGLFLAVVLVVNVLFRRWLSAGQMGLLWGLVLIRLLVPWAPSSSFSLQNLFPWEPLETHSDVTAAGSVGAGYSRSTAASYPLPDAQLPAAKTLTSRPIDLSLTLEMFLGALPFVWFIVGAAGLTRTTIVHWRFCRRLKQVPRCGDQHLLDLWEACCEQAGVRMRIPILLCDAVQQPAILGLFRAKLVLPTDATDLNDEQLRMVMLHELAHVRRWDIASNWLLLLIWAIHWWNPVYWLAAARFQSLREQACDAFVIRRMKGQSARGYSELLLTLAQRQPSGPSWRVMLPASILGFLPFFFRKRAIRNRLRALRSAAVTRSRWHAAAVAGVIIAAAVAGLTDARTPEKPSERSSDWLPRAGHTQNHWNSVAETDPGPSVTRSYDIEKVLNRIADDERTKEDARVKLNSVLTHILRISRVQLHVGQRHNALANEQQGAQATHTLDGAVLTVNAPLSVQAELARNLSAWEQSGLGQICLATRFITDERDIASAIGVSWRYLEAFSADREEDLASPATVGMPVVRAKAAVDDYLPIAVATLNGQQALALVQAAQGERSANVLQAPKITVFNGQQASVFDGSQTPFVVGVQDVSAGVQQSKIAIIDEGIKLTLRAIQGSDRKKMYLEGRVELSEIGEVHETSTKLRGESATIQIPRVKRCRIDVASEIDDGQSLLIGCIPTYERKRFFYVLLTARNVAEPTDETH